jgi:hypothetical protein
VVISTQLVSYGTEQTISVIERFMVGEAWWQRDKVLLLKRLAFIPFGFHSKMNCIRADLFNFLF